MAPHILYTRSATTNAAQCYIQLRIVNSPFENSTMELQGGGKKVDKVTGNQGVHSSRGGPLGESLDNDVPCQDTIGVVLRKMTITEPQYLPKNNGVPDLSNTGLSSEEGSTSSFVDENYVAPPEVDNDSTETDDGGPEISDFNTTSSSVSANSNLHETIEENGRTYHHEKEGKYYLPDDKLESDRLNLQHILFGLTFHNNLYLAPIEEPPKEVLDIGSGTGI